MDLSNPGKKWLPFLLLGGLLIADACSSDDPAEPEPDITAPEGLFINEVYSAGDDWIEIYNLGETPKDISNYFVFDDPALKYKLPAGTTVPAKGFLVIFCDDTSTGLHTNFKLTSDGETVYLANTAGEVVDKVEFPKLDNGQSYARFPDGAATWQVTGKTSQGTSNDASNAPAITTIARTPLVPALGQAVTVQVEIINTSALASVKLFYRVNGGAYTEAAMTLASGKYSATIPAQNNTGRVDYYVEAKTNAGVSTRKPFDAPTDAYKFLLNTDALPKLFINEFLASNTSCCPDTDGGAQEFDDWIEVYNAGTEAIDLGGMYLSDDKTDPFKAKIPDDNPAATTIQPGGFLVFWADESGSQGARHLNFKLSASGEDVAIFYIDGRTIHTYTYGNQTDNVSNGLTTDGVGPFKAFATPTPGKTNN